MLIIVMSIPETVIWCWYHHLCKEFPDKSQTPKILGNMMGDFSLWLKSKIQNLETFDIPV